MFWRSAECRQNRMFNVKSHALPAFEDNPGGVPKLHWLAMGAADKAAEEAAARCQLPGIILVQREEVDVPITDQDGR